MQGGVTEEMAAGSRVTFGGAQTIPWSCSDNTLELQVLCGQSRDGGKTQCGSYGVDYGFSIWRECKGVQSLAELGVRCCWMSQRGIQSSIKWHLGRALPNTL